MSADFTVIIDSREHLGDTEGRFNREAPECHFAGQSGVYAFDTPGVDNGSNAILTFRTFGVDLQTNKLAINGTEIPFALAPSVEREWHTHSIVIPASLLKEQGNELMLDARTRSGEAEGNVDDFLVDNMSIMYKTR